MKYACHRVWVFHDKTGAYLADKPEIPPDVVRHLRMRLVREEFEELISAMQQDDMVEIADGIADLIYVLIGTAGSYGIPLPDIYEEVCNTNDLKWTSGVTKDAGGKVLKPDNWQPPKIKEILDAAVQDYQRGGDHNTGESSASDVRSGTHQRAGSGHEEATRDPESDSPQER